MAGDAKEMPSDLSEFCRVCLQLPQASQYLDLSTIYDEEDHLTYSDCFTICTQIDLKAGIGVPHHLCKSCGLELQMSYDFHKKVEESKRVIEKYEKKMQDGTNEQQLLYKPLPQKVVQKNQQQDTNEQELNDATTFFLSPMVVEGNNLPHSQKTLDLTQDEQEYLGSSDEENGVELLSKIGSIRDTVADDQENEHLVPMADCIEIEEHLEMEDFQNLETLEEEEPIPNPETVIIKAESIEEDIEEINPCNIQQFSNDNIEEIIKIESEVARYHVTVIQKEPANVKEEIQEQYQIMELANTENITQEENEIVKVNHRRIKIIPKVKQNVELPYQCYICGHSYMDEYSLLQHHKWIHNRKQSIIVKQPVVLKNKSICNLCGYECLNLYYLSQHRLRKHPNNNIKEKPFESEQDQHTIKDVTQETEEIISNKATEEIKIQYGFVTNKSKMMQKIQQRVASPFKCDLCGYSSLTENLLFNHQKRKHGRNRIDNTTAKASVSGQTLIAKKGIFTCKLCGHSFLSSNSLCQHRLIKHGISESIEENQDTFILDLKPFKCEICEHRSTTKRALYLHHWRKHKKQQ